MSAELALVFVGYGIGVVTTLGGLVVIGLARKWLHLPPWLAVVIVAMSASGCTTPPAAKASNAAQRAKPALEQYRPEGCLR